VEIVNQEQAEHWEAMAPTWVELADRMEQMAGPPGRLAMDRLDPQPGSKVLDLGCGTGPTAVELAHRVGGSGSVVGVDIAEEMLAAARRRAAEQGLDNVTFVHADVQGQDLGSSDFDGAFSRFGVMFFSDPVAAFTNVRRALRPGGRLSFACWQNAFENEWMLVPAVAVMTVTGSAPPMPEPGQPGPFSLSDPDRVQTVLAEAGFGNIDITPHNDLVIGQETDIPDLAQASLRVGAAREALKDADEATKQKAYEAVVEALDSKVESGVVRLTRGVFLVTAQPG
jgi:SAM-dependent methyltransferase